MSCQYNSCWRHALENIETCIHRNTDACSCSCQQACCPVLHLPGPEVSDLSPCASSNEIACKVNELLDSLRKAGLITSHNGTNCLY